MKKYAATLSAFVILAALTLSPAESAMAQDADVAPADEPAEDAPPTAPLGDYEPPAIQRDLDALPFPVRRMRELLIEAAEAGEIERLRPYIGEGEDMTLLSFGDQPQDPIDFLKSLSGDAEGYEILAILQEVLETGYVHIDEGTENELYVWPYFYRVRLDKLTPAQRVELYHLLTHGDFEDMKALGAYLFYRVGITPRGRWRFFVAGD